MKLYRQPPPPPPAPTRYETRAGEIMQIQYSIRKEREQLEGYRRRYPVAGEEERAQIEAWADACKRSLAELETKLETLSPRSRSA